jgi:crossover junction endodeoxyribonuclease RusA
VSLTFTVKGRPAPQGSKRSIGNNRFIEASKFLPAWRKAVSEQAREAVTEQQWQQVAGPVELYVVFYLERPASISANKRPLPIKPPDIDKLVRGVADSLSDAEVWVDDAQVVKLIARKAYADDMAPGVYVEITEV